MPINIKNKGDVGKINIKGVGDVGKVVQKTAEGILDIWPAEQKFIENSTWLNGYAYTPLQTSWLGHVSGTQVYTRVPDQGSSGTYVASAYILLPTSDFSKIKISGSFKTFGGGGITGMAYAVLRKNPISISGWDAANQILNGATHWLGTSNAPNYANLETEWDISDIKEDYVLECGVMSHNWSEPSWGTASRVLLTHLELY